MEEEQTKISCAKWLQACTRRVFTLSGWAQTSLLEELEARDEANEGEEQQDEEVENDDEDEDVEGEDEDSEDGESEEEHPRMEWTKHLSIILAGTRDKDSPLSLFRGHEGVIIKTIYTRLFELWGELAVTRTACTSAPFQRMISDKRELAFSTCGFVRFPEPTAINVNMLPFIMGDLDSLPKQLAHYHDLIMECPVQDSELGKVCYLTITEGLVPEGATQRRGGLHCEAPNGLGHEPSFRNEAFFYSGLAGFGGEFWGGGEAHDPDDVHGGLFMASTVSNTCAVYSALVDKNEVDHHGGMEHLRPFLGQGHNLQAHELVWLTDRTPHEALPQTGAEHRQYFRLVTSEISVWFAQHSTSNPKVPLPDFVKVVEESKFRRS